MEPPILYQHRATTEERRHPATVFGVVCRFAHGRSPGRVVGAERGQCRFLSGQLGGGGGRAQPADDDRDGAAHVGGVVGSEAAEQAVDERIVERAVENVGAARAHDCTSWALPSTGAGLVAGPNVRARFLSPRCASTRTVPGRLPITSATCCTSRPATVRSATTSA